MLEQSPESDTVVGGFAKSIRKCFSFDTNPLSPTPKGIIKKILALWLYPRYSMYLYLRLAQYIHYRDAEKGGIFLLLAYFFRRKNEVKNNSEVNCDDYIGPGVIFHHTGVTITAGSVIEPGAHIYNNVTLGSRNGEAPYIKKGAKLGSHTVILSGVTVGAKAIVAPGAVLVSDVEEGMVVAGVPAKIVGKVTELNYNF